MLNITLQNILDKEANRQKEYISLIASDNFASENIIKYSGNIFANKYAEGYVGRRYYPGTIVIDELEELCKKQALSVFKLDPNEWHVNVQPYAGSVANLAVYLALVPLGEKVMGLDLAQGGHLSHGHKANFSSKAWDIIPYGLNVETDLIDYDNAEKKALAQHPKMIICGASAYPRTIDFERFGKIAKSVNAYLLADISHIAGLVATGEHPSPFEHSDVIMTTTHKTLRGPRSAVIFCKKELASKIDKAVFPGLQGGPHENTILAKTICFQEAQTREFKEYQQQVIKNAQTLAQELKNKGFNLITDGTDNHLMLVDLKNKNITGEQAQDLLEQAHILANRNTVPGDTNAFKPSGIRLGTPAMTTKGFKEKEFKKVAYFIDDLITNSINTETIKTQVIEMITSME